MSKTLPLELFEEVLSHLNNGLDMQSATLVSRNWKRAVIDTAKFKEYCLMKEWVETVCTHLDFEIYSSYRAYLRKIIKDTPILNSSNLIEVKQATLVIRKKILQILKYFDINMLGNIEVAMEGKNKPLFFGEILELEKINREIHEWDIALDGDDKQYAQKNISERLTQLGWIDKGIEVANSIADKNLKAVSLKDISSDLIKSGDIDKAIEVANLISLRDVKITALDNIRIALMESSDFGKAIKVADTIPTDLDKGHALRVISIALAKGGDIERSVEAANKIPGERVRRVALKNIFKSPKPSDLRVIHQIPNEADQRYILKLINSETEKS